MEKSTSWRVPSWRLLAAFGVLVALLCASFTEAAFAGKGQVHKFNANKDVLVVKKKGKKKKLDVPSDAKIRLEKKNGKTYRANENELVPGADIEGIEKSNGELEEIDLEETEAGSSDCSFDFSDQNENLDESFDCSEDYRDESQDCSFDQSGDKSPGDMSKDASWDCSYEDDTLSWDCSYDSSQSSSWDPDGGDSDGDFSFDCSWESEEDLSGPLFDCSFGEQGIAFHCISPMTGQDFGASIDIGSAVVLDPTVDFNEDVVEEDSDADDSNCSGGGAALSCSFSGDREVGDCEADFSYDESHEPGYRSGDVSGDASVDCSYERGNPDDL